MDTPLSAPDLANTVTSFCTILAGVVPLLFCRWVGPQPPRWVAFYASIVLTGIPTFLWHGWLLPVFQVLDVGSNLLLGVALQVAVLGDFYAPATQRRVGWASGVLNGLVVVWMVSEAVVGPQAYAIDLGDFGGFFVGEAMLIADSLLATALIYARRDRIPDRARPLLYVVTGSFILGLYLASASGTTVHHRWLSYHALWHVVGAFGFVVFWAFNHVRFTPAAPQGTPRQP